MLYTVPDDALPSSIYACRGVGAGSSPAVRERMPVTRDGAQALFDLEGIAIDTSVARPRQNGRLLAGLRGQRQFGTRKP